MKKKYSVSWGRLYVARGTEVIEAESEEEALAIAEEESGDWTGTLDGTDEPDEFSISEIEEE